MSERDGSYEERAAKRPRMDIDAGAGGTTEADTRVCFVKGDNDDSWSRITITGKNVAGLTAAVHVQLKLNAEASCVLYITDKNGRSLRRSLRHSSDHTQYLRELLDSAEPLYIVVKEYPPTIEGSIAFLKDRGVFSSSEIDAFYVSYLRNPDLEENKEERKYFEDVQARALRLVQPVGTRAFDALPPDVHTFSAAEFPGYATLPYITDPTLHAQCYAQSHQLSGLCYMHAGAMIQYYSIWHAVRQSDPAAMSTHGILDLAYAIRSTFPSRALRRHVFVEDGGDSKDFLEFILLPGSRLRPCAFDEDIQAALNKYGPALVCSFRVHEDFKDTEIHHHYGDPTGPFAGLHAMVLHGVREDAKHGRCFLLQNWWKRKQFVEVNETYLRKVGAVLLFVETPQTSTSPSHGTLRGHYFENELLDKPEFHYLEGMAVTPRSLASPLCICV